MTLRASRRVLLGAMLALAVVTAGGFVLLSRLQASPTSAQRERLAAIVERPADHYGDAVTVAGEAILVRPRSIVLRANGARLLVSRRPSDRDVEARAGDLIRVAGVVRRVAAASSPALPEDPTLLDEFAGRPTLEATSISQLEPASSSRE